MKMISELESALAATREQHGDIPLGGGYMNEEVGPMKVTVLDEDGCAVGPVIGNAHSVFFESV